MNRIEVLKDRATASLRDFVFDGIAANHRKETLEASISKDISGIVASAYQRHSPRHGIAIEYLSESEKRLVQTVDADESWDTVALAAAEERDASEVLATVEDDILADLKHSEYSKLLVLRKNVREYLAETSKNQDKIRDFFGSSDGAWDLEPGVWKRISWPALESANNALREWPVLAEIAAVVGRSRFDEVEEEEKQETSRQAKSQKVVKVEDLGRSEIVGLTQGRDLALLTSHEIGLLCDDKCSDFFLQKYAEQRLQNLEYVSEHVIVTNEGDDQVSVFDQRGPIIFCVDSSGSMAGYPEYVARGMALALCRECLQQKRRVWLIAFSTEIRCLGVIDPIKSLEKIAEFFQFAFRGGTDLRPALQKSIEIASSPEGVNADVLVISDFRVPKIMIKRHGELSRLRTGSKVRYFGISVTRETPQDDLHIFDRLWHFQIGFHGPVGIVSH